MAVLDTGGFGGDGLESAARLSFGDFADDDIPAPPRSPRFGLAAAVAASLAASLALLILL